MTDKYHSDTRQRAERILYQPGLYDTGNLIASPTTVTAVEEASGTEYADYNHPIAIQMPQDIRLLVKRLCTRLEVVIDGMTTGNLYCRVYIDQQDQEHLLIDETWTAPGTKLAAHALTQNTVFNLLSDGTGHTLFFFFWVNTGDAIISKVELWEAVGQTDSSGSSYCLELEYSGFIQISGIIRRLGTGYMDVRGSISPGTDKNEGIVWRFSKTASYGIIGLEQPNTLALVADKFYLMTQASVPTDIVYVDNLVINLLGSR